VNKYTVFNVSPFFQRPIVAFSIENRVMVNAKKRRLEKSRQHNPLYNAGKRQGGKDEEASGEVKGGKRYAKRRKQSEKKRSLENAGGDNVEAYVGTAGKAGLTKMNSKFFLKKQAQLHNEKLKESKKKSKSMRQLTLKKKEEALSRREAKVRTDTVIHFGRIWQLGSRERVTRSLF
jgi:nucleolar protein 4